MEIALVITSTMSISFLIAYLSVSRKLKTVSKGFTQLFFTYNSLRDVIESNSSNGEDIHKENFIKFLSDSRDWAFEYIENVQAGINRFVKEVEPSIQYFNKYGIVVEGMPHYKDMLKISREFEELKKFLPEANDDRR